MPTFGSFRALKYVCSDLEMKYGPIMHSTLKYHFCMFSSFRCIV